MKGFFFPQAAKNDETQVSKHETTTSPRLPPLQGVPITVSNVFVVFLIKCKYVSKIDFKIPLQKCVYSYKLGSETNLVINFKQN